MRHGTAIGATGDASAGGRPEESQTPDAPATIQFNEVNFAYPGASPILEGVNLTVTKGEILVLIGASGCGKSTLLNLIAGILRPTDGAISSDGRPVRGLNHGVSYMTQRDTLLPWRNALDNVGLPLEIKGVSRHERRESARRAIARVGIAPSAERLRPHQLSGGMRSRLALGRLLLSDTEIILMDEPFAAVDALLRVRLQQLLLDVWQETGKTIVYVTHDLDEAITLGHRVVVMARHPGRIAHERPIPFPHPRDASRFRAQPEARNIYVELLDALERTTT